MSAERNIETKINVIPESGRRPEFPPDRYTLITVFDESYVAYAVWVGNKSKSKEPLNEKEKKLIAGFNTITGELKAVSGGPVVTTRALNNDIARDSFRYEFEDPYTKEVFAWERHINVCHLERFIRFRIEELEGFLEVDFREKSEKDKEPTRAVIKTYFNNMQTLLDSSLPSEEVHNTATNPKARKAYLEVNSYEVSENDLLKAGDPKGKSEAEADKISKENWRRAEIELEEGRELFISEKVNDTVGCREARNGCLPVFPAIYGLGSEFRWMAGQSIDDLGGKLRFLGYDIQEWRVKKKSDLLNGVGRMTDNIRNKFEGMLSWRPKWPDRPGLEGYRVGEIDGEPLLAAPVKSLRQEEEERKRRGCLPLIVGLPLLLCVLTQLGPCEDDYRKLEESPVGPVPGQSEPSEHEYLSLYGKFLADLAEFDPKVLQMLAGEPKAKELAKLQEEIKSVKEANGGNIPAENEAFNRAVYFAANALGSENVQLFWQLFVERFNKLNPENPLIDGVDKVEDRFDEEYEFRDYAYDPEGKAYPKVSRLPEGLIIPPRDYYLDPKFWKKAAYVFGQVDGIMASRRKGDLS